MFVAQLRVHNYIETIGLSLALVFTELLDHVWSQAQPPRLSLKDHRSHVLSQAY